MQSNGINWIKIGDISPKENVIKTTKEKITEEGAKHSRYVRKGDLILSNSMSFGRPYILEIDGCIHDGWLLIQDLEKLFDKKYLCYLLDSDTVKHQYRKYKTTDFQYRRNRELASFACMGCQHNRKCGNLAHCFKRHTRHGKHKTSTEA